MRHRLLKGKLSVATDHRKAMMRGLAASLFLHQRIKTTKTNAKAVRGFAERLITLAKIDGFNARRRAVSLLCNMQAVDILFNKIAPLFKDRQGGYTRIIKIGRRKGDGAEMAWLELTAKTPTAPKAKIHPPKETQQKIETQPKPAAEIAREKLPQKIEKPKKGFFEGLRKIFRRKV